MRKRARVRCNLIDAKDRRAVRRLVMRLKLDRRKVYTLGHDGELATEEWFTGACSGCSCDCGEGYGCSHGGAGCDECGYTGKVKQYFPLPIDRPKLGLIQVRPHNAQASGAEEKQS